MYRTQHSTAAHFSPYFQDAKPQSNTVQQFQSQWFGPTQNSLHDQFYSQSNMTNLQRAIQQGGGFNAAPDVGSVIDHMDQQWSFHATPDNIIDLVGREDPAFGSQTLQKMNSGVVDALTKNMRQMQRQDQLYLYDMASYGMGRAGQFDRPEYTMNNRGTTSTVFQQPF